MVSLCSEKYYVEFFWFPSQGEEKGYWENCWDNDGRYKVMHQMDFVQ